MKIAIIVAYFGKLPDYFQLFLDSCKFNYGFEWLIFSDDDAVYNYPSNVHLIKMKFSECKELIQSKFDFEITLSNPQKLCDYKCAYGVIFEEYIQGYDWWGHCDFDQIFGNLGAFITDDMLASYDKIGSIGHLTLYRNNHENNIVFMSTKRYKEVFSTECGCGFDEWMPGNVNEIYMKSNYRVFWKNLGADINPYRTAFQLVDYNIDNRVYECSDVTNSIFLYKSGTLFQFCLCSGEVMYTEYPYVHFQKRVMVDCRSGQQIDKFYIIPNRFVDGEMDEKKLILRAQLKSIINIQYIKVKWNSLKYRIKNGDWEFSNVFKRR